MDQRRWNEGVDETVEVVEELRRRELQCRQELTRQWRKCAIDTLPARRRAPWCRGKAKCWQGQGTKVEDTTGHQQRHYARQGRARCPGWTRKCMPNGGQTREQRACPGHGREACGRWGRRTPYPPTWGGSGKSRRRRPATPVEGAVASLSGQQLLGKKGEPMMDDENVEGQHWYECWMCRPWGWWGKSAWGCSSSAAAAKADLAAYKACSIGFDHSRDLPGPWSASVRGSKNPAVPLRKCQ